MITPVRLRTVVLPGGKIEITAPELLPGEDVEVIVMATRTLSEAPRSALDILAQASWHRQFQTADEVDSYLREERASWDD